MTHHERQAGERAEAGRPAAERNPRHPEQRSFLEKGAGASNASAAAGGSPSPDLGDENAPHARPADHSLRSEEKPDQLSGQQAEDRQEALIDESVEESFPASDPPTPKRIT